jgi:hypothetical protein
MIHAHRALLAAAVLAACATGTAAVANNTSTAAATQNSTATAITTSPPPTTTPPPTTRTGKVACERDKLDEKSCKAIGCCQWNKAGSTGECKSRVGDGICTSVLCGTGDTDSECRHCTDTQKQQCNSKDCKLEGGKCVAGNGLMTATIDKGSKFFLTLTVTLPYTKDQFDQSKQDKYKAAVASAAGTVAANVEIVKITEARRRAGKVAVETKVRHYYTLWSRRAVTCATCSELVRRLHLKQSPGTACLR